MTLTLIRPLVPIELLHARWCWTRRGTTAIAAADGRAPALRPATFSYLCRICHSDLHQCRNDWHNSVYPVVPGHEIIGEVTAVGPEVTKYKVGDLVAVGTIVDADLTCRECIAGWEKVCLSGSTYTYNGVDKIDGTITKGGYSDHIVVREHFVFRVPEKLDPSKAAPLLCAGIIGYRSYRLGGIRPGESLGLYGFGASAHLVIQLARHQKCNVFVFTRSEAHRAHARELGAGWTGRAEDTPPEPLHAAIIFAPAGSLVRESLRVLRKGGTLALAGILDIVLPRALL